jgi:DNA repair photolyase
MKIFKGKAIYNPSGKAGEYSYWACNFYVGCSNGCDYCYCKKGILAGTMGGDKAVLKKCFHNKKHAMEEFRKDISKNWVELQKDGLFFTFTSDPFLSETIQLTTAAIRECIYHLIPVKLLTKKADWLGKTENPDDLNFGYTNFPFDIHENHRCTIAFGFTLTGHDELEPGASSNYERMIAMKKLHDAGFKTWASIEPIIDFRSSFEMIQDTNGFCDLYKIGLKSGSLHSSILIKDFIDGVLKQVEFYGAKVYFKDSLLKQAGISREELPANCVGRDYKLHEEKR